MLDDHEALAGMRIDDFLDDFYGRRFLDGSFLDDRLRGRDFLSNDRNFDDRFL